MGRGNGFCRGETPHWLMMRFIFAAMALGCLVSAAAAFEAGKLSGPVPWRGKSFRNTYRNHWVYVPKAYNPTKPAALAIFLGGGSWVGSPQDAASVTATIEELTEQKEIPICVSVFLDPGAPDSGGSPSLAEYEAPDEDYAQFLIEEFIPNALRGLNVTKNAAGHALVGSESAGVAAFTAAWFRPDYFQKVLSLDSVFTGSHDYVRKIEGSVRRPLRIVLHTSATTGEGTRVPEALAAKNYDVHVLTATESLKQQLRTLWHGYVQNPPDFDTLAATAPADAPFGTPGTRWEVTFGGMSAPVTYEFRANNVLYWVEYEVADNYEFRAGQLLTTSLSDPPGRYRTWEVTGSTFARVINNALPDVEIGLTAKGSLKRVR